MYAPQKFIEARLKIGKTQTEIAKETGLDQSQVSNVENGKKKKPYEELFVFYEKYDIPRDFFLIEEINLSKVEQLTKENEKLKTENKSLRTELREVREKLDRIQEALANKFLGLDLGKRKASSTTKATLSKEDLSLFALNFG